MCHKSYQATHLLFKQNFQGGEVKTCADNADTGVGVQNLEKLNNNVILEHSLMPKGLNITAKLALTLWWSSSIKDCPPLKVVFNQRLSSISIKGRLPLKVVFYQRLSSIKVHPPSKKHTRIYHHIHIDEGGCFRNFSWLQIINFISAKYKKCIEESLNQYHSQLLYFLCQGSK